MKLEHTFHVRTTIVDRLSGSRHIGVRKKPWVDYILRRLLEESRTWNPLLSFEASAVPQWSFSGLASGPFPPRAFNDYFDLSQHLNRRASAFDA
jgi:hypothetical protein